MSCRWRSLLLLYLLFFFILLNCFPSCVFCLFCPPAAPSGSSNLLQKETDETEEVKEAELIVSVRQVVAERFSGNPAYQLLKARFLSCFTVPAVLATVQPIREQAVSCPANKEKEVEEVEEREKDEDLKKIKERGKQRKAVVSSGTVRFFTQVLRVT